ncbi:unnamed protein product [Brugia timori]|uniref:Uncharacterized protein n=1 Tax=Brugia timori TaxID=42155 RepID=A0A3P7UDJ8_9BILA|nr:unnamed protein product [Brugia timori]
MSGWDKPVISICLAIFGQNYRYVGERCQAAEVDTRQTGNFS